MKSLKRHTALAGAALLLFGAPACTDGPTGPGDVKPITELPRALSAVERQVLTASNRFAFALGRELLPTDPRQNLFFSPLSASMALGMTLNGADGRTFEQMRETLALQGLTQEQINQGYADLIELLLELDPSVTVGIGNSVWTRRGFPVLPDFMSRVRTSFDAEAADLDFSDPASLTRINRWVSDRTDGRIEKIFEQMPPKAVMILLNAIYFKGGWTTQFEKARTEKAPFTRADGSTVTVDLMRLESEKLRSAWREEAAIVELPYGGGAYTMVVMVPRAGLSAAELARGLTPEKWDAWLADLREGKAVVRLPRFQLEWEDSLNSPLQKLGMTDAFEPGLADFRRLTPGGGVWIGLVKQKSFVKVDEEGTVAAAVTAVVMDDSAPAEIRADRPFLFAIRERLTGTVVFMGVVNDPMR